MADWPYSTRAWQRLRAAKLAADPLCEYCPPGSTTPATDVDHRKAIAAGGDPWAWDNLASACHGCHSRKTRHVDVLGKDRVPIKGCDPTTGRPLDPGHWWNK
jgi:5-methylcytosine-specific restriction protein A